MAKDSFRIDHNLQVIYVHDSFISKKSDRYAYVFLGKTFVVYSYLVNF